MSLMHAMPFGSHLLPPGANAPLLERTSRKQTSSIIFGQRSGSDFFRYFDLPGPGLKTR